MGHGRGQQVHRVSDAPEPLAVEQARRMRTYLLQMGVRLVCILAAALVPSWPLRVVCIAGAVLLPYTAVLLANAGRDRRTTGAVLLDPRALPRVPDRPSDASGRAPEDDRSARTTDEDPTTDPDGPEPPRHPEDR